MECLPTLWDFWKNFNDQTGEDDVDLLVENYTAAIEALRSFPAEWDMTEDGGARVAHWVNIGGCPIKFDIRYKGDNFFAEPWEEDMLESRRFLGDSEEEGFWTLDPEHEFWSILYHKTIHDGGLNEKYFELMRQLDPFDNMDITQASHRVHLDLLQQFTLNTSYKFVAPRDWSEPFLGVISHGNEANGGFAKRVGDFRINCLDPRRMWMFMHGIGDEDLAMAQRTFEQKTKFVIVLTASNINLSFILCFVPVAF